MKDIPAHLECAYCERNRNVGGECKSSERLNGCLAFKMNPLGCIKSTTTRMVLPLFYEVPKVGIWTDEFTWRDKDTKLKIDRILNIGWDSKKGLIEIDVEIKYFENDFADDYQEPSKQHKLKLIKGGAE